MIVLEDLAVTNMVRNRTLAKAIADCGWGTFRAMLEYKAARYGRRVIIVDRWYPPSKTCSACGYLLAALVAAVRPPWAGEHLATLEQRISQIDAVYARLAETFAERTTQEWLDVLRPLGIPSAPVRTLDELFGNPHLNEVGFFETVDTPNGPVRFPGPPTWFSRTPGRIAGPAPPAGRAHDGDNERDWRTLRRGGGRWPLARAPGCSPRVTVSGR